MTLSVAAPTLSRPFLRFSFEGTQVNLRAGETVEGIDFKLTRGAVITGRVTDADGRPVIEERLELHRVDEKGNPTGYEYSSNGAEQMYYTDDRGVYRIYGLAAGHYKVRVGDDTGFRSALGELGSYPTTYYGDTSDAAKASIVDLNEGSEERNIDIHLGRRRPTYTVSGRVIDAESGEPIEGTRIALGFIESQTDYIGSWSSPKTPTDSQGRFSLSGVEPGHHAVFVQPDRRGMNEDTRNPNVFSDPEYFEVTDADITDLEIKAHRATTVSGQAIPDNIRDVSALNNLFRLRIRAEVAPPTELATKTIPWKCGSKRKT